MSWTSSLATRSATAWSLVAAAAAAISSWIAHKDAEIRYLDTLRQRVQQEAGNIQIKSQTAFASLREDARFCSQSPLLREFLLHRGTADEPRWRRLLEEEFSAVFSGKPPYYQMRLLALGGPEDGHELVRLDRRPNGIEVTPMGKLQGKAGRTYFQEARHLPLDRVYLSEINLNRDFGVVSEPHIPTLRAAARVSVPARGEALLIINTNLEPLFQELRQLTSPASEVRLISSRGDYLMHPRPQAAFAADLRTDHFASREFDRLPEWTDRSSGLWLREVDEGALAWAIHLPLGDWPERSLTAVVSLPAKVWMPTLQAARRRTQGVTLAAALLGGGAAFLIALPMVRRLHLLSAALRKFDATGSPDSLADADAHAGRDEIGIAVSRFREMATKVRQQVERLHEARAEAEAANELKEQFLAVMSHEIRTPLNAVVGLIEALESNDPPPRQLPLLHTLRSAADSLMALVSTALDYTRLKDGDIPFLDEDFDLAELVRETVRAHTPTAMSKGLEIGSHGSETPLWIRGDPVRARQVLTNLLNNAIKFTSNGFVMVSLAREQEWVRLEVSDSGPGIAPDERELIFEPFAQAFTARGASQAGAGLGLTVSRALLERQEGSLELVSEEGRGSTFTARWPFRQGRPPSSGTDPEGDRGAAQPLSGIRLLYVEDVASNQQVMECALEGTGADLTCVATAQDALNHLAREAAEVVLIDLQLPDLPGDVLAEKLLAEPGPHPPPLVLAVTAQASEAAAERCRRAGMRAVILKPFTRETLLREIARCLGRSFPDPQALAAIHPDDAGRRADLARTLAGELRRAASDAHRTRTLTPEERHRRLRSLHHRLKTTIVTLDLQTVEETFSKALAIRDGAGPDAPDELALAQALDRLAQALNRAAEQLDPKQEFS